MGLVLSEHFEKGLKLGVTVPFVGMIFEHRLSVDQLSPDSHLNVDDYRRLYGTDGLGVAQLAIQISIFEGKYHDTGFESVSTQEHLRVKEHVGQDYIERAKRAYGDLLQDIKQDITHFDRQLHDDPRIHNVMLVDYLVNSRMKYISETHKTDGSFGELWQDARHTSIDMQGDCEDYAILKLKLIQDLGLVERNEAYIMSVDDRKQGHAVLVVNGQDGRPYAFNNFEENDEDPLKAYAIPFEDYYKENVNRIISIFNGEDLLLPQQVRPDKQREAVLQPATNQLSM